MTRQEILEKAIHKAEKNGWNNKTRKYSGIDQAWMIDADNNPSIEELIYNHDFAKALWPKKGEAKMYYSYPIHWRLFKDDELHATTALLTEWQYHLQQMVLADDPLDYLAKNI